MVSNALAISVEELYAALERLRVEHGTDPEYVKLRGVLPADWPL
jgi:hypothetical protein